MKLKVLQEDLGKAVSIVNRFVNPRVQLPILGNIVLKASKTNLTLLATNLELSIAKKIGADVSEEGELAIPGKIISELVGNLPKGQITFESDKENLKITSSGFSGKVSGMQTSEFPKVSESIGKGNVSISVGELIHGLTKVSFCASVDETRPVINGVLFIFNKKKLTLVSTDGFRLSQKSIIIGEETELDRIILPKSAISEILRVEDQKDSIQIEVRQKESQIAFGVGEMVVASRLISGEFPKFENIIPKSSQTKVIIDKEELLRVVKLASVFAKDNANMVKFSITKNSLKVSAESPKSGSQEGEVEAKVEGGEMEIIFNYRFVEELLNVIEGDEVIMELGGTSAPGVFRDIKDPEFLHLIMPVKIQS